MADIKELVKRAANSSTTAEKMHIYDLMQAINHPDRKGEPYGLAGMLEQAFNQIGTSMMSDDFAAKLLAYVYVLGGGNEAVVMHAGLNAGIQIAQQKAKLYGGHIPNPDITVPFNKYRAELEEAERNAKRVREIYDNVPWLKEIFDRYNLTVK